MKPLVLSAQQIEKLCDRKSLRHCMADALRAFSMQEAMNFPRHVVDLSPNASQGYMSAHAKQAGISGFKVVSVIPANATIGLNPHQGIVVLIDPSNGQVKSILDGEAVTAFRTAAVSAVATDLLSRKNSRSLAVIGTGRQAFEHVIALMEVRRFERVIVFGRSPKSVQNLILSLKAQSILAEFQIASTAKQAVAEGDVVVTCTSSHEPAFETGDLPRGVHVNAVGACRPEQHEIILRLRPELKIYLDSITSCLLEASEIRDALATNRISRATIVGEVGQCVAGKIKGRTSDLDITIFKSIGLGVEDIFAAQYFLERATKEKTDG